MRGGGNGKTKKPSRDKAKQLWLESGKSYQLKNIKALGIILKQEKHEGDT
jgi:hypothetical protein